MVSEPAAAPARWIDVAPERFPGWIESFGGRHGAVRVADEPGDAEPDGAVVFVAADGAVARAHAPFPPVPGLTGAREAGDREHPSVRAPWVRASQVRIRARWPG